eukprot:jgi/Tetstr1/466226/TSEL_010783.t1
MPSSLSVSGGAEHRISRQLPKEDERPAAGSLSPRKGAGGLVPRTQRVPSSGKPNMLMVMALLLMGGCAFVLLPSSNVADGPAQRHTRPAGSAQVAGVVDRPSARRKERGSSTHRQEDAGRPGRAGRKPAPSARANAVDFGDAAPRRPAAKQPGQRQQEFGSVQEVDVAAAGAEVAEEAEEAEAEEAEAEQDGADGIGGAGRQQGQSSRAEVAVKFLEEEEEEEGSGADPLEELRDTVAEAAHHKAAGSGRLGQGGAAQSARDAGAEEGEAEEGEEGGDGGRQGADPPPGTQRGEWRWTGSVWRKIVGGSVDGDRSEISWWERRTVQDRLDFDKFINCASTARASRERPSLEGLPVKMKWKVNDYLVHQGNYGVLHKGADQNRTQRIRHPELLPPDGESVLRARPGQWGSCAVVGNSGVLRLTEMNRAIDSHDTIFRINQAPTFGYSRRVGRKVTHRVLNRLWTRTYRNDKGVKKGTTLPMEKDVTFLVARATSQEYELLVEFLSEFRPDVAVWYVSSRAATGPGPLLLGYRERLCKAGFGPYKGLNVPSSGFMAIIMLLPLCDRVTVYGFGVEGMKNRKVDESFGYHYYKGVGMRHVGDDVHCFDCEEKVLQQMGTEGVIDFCTFDPEDETNSWACGCRHEDVEECRPPPRPSWLKETDDCDPWYDDCAGLEAYRLKRAAARAKGRVGGGGGGGVRTSVQHSSSSSVRSRRP